MLHFPANRTHHRHFPRCKECTEFRQSKKLFLRKSRRSLYQWQFEQILPNIISCSFIYKGIRARTYINIIKVTIIALILPIGVQYYIDESWGGFIISCIICFISVFISIVYVGCNRQERAFIMTKAESFIHNFF